MNDKKDLGLPWIVQTEQFTKDKSIVGEVPVIRTGGCDIIFASTGDAPDVVNRKAQFILSAIAERDEAIKAFQHLLDVCGTEPEPSLALESVTADSMHILTKLKANQ